MSVGYKQAVRFIIRASLAASSSWVLMGCGSKEERPANVEPELVNRSEQGTNYCATANQGCACDTEGQSIDCGRVVSKYDDYVVCTTGKRTCSEGKWGECIGTNIEQRSTLSWNGQRSGLSPSRSVMGLGTTTSSCDNPCDAQCVNLVDSGGSFDAGSGFVNDTSGLSLARTSVNGCNTLTITPSATTATVTQIVPSVVASPVTLTAKLDASCVASPFPVAWTVDRFDIAGISGTTSANGSLNVLHPISGDVTVTAYAVGLSASTKIRVKVNTVQWNNVAPNDAATAAQIGKFGGAGTVASRVTWLYPYASTYFPLGLLAPVVQYWFSTETYGGATKVSLRYPVGSTASTADFNYSLIVAETNNVSKSAPANRPVKTTDPQVVIPQAAWEAFEQAARGKDAAIVIQRLRNDGTTLEVENPRTIRIVDGQLKGTVFYNSYSSQLNSANTGAVLAINPGASAPVIAAQPSGKCTVCHTLNADGTKLIVSGGRPSGSVQYDNSRRYDLSDPSQWPSPLVLNNYDSPTGTDVTNIPGDKFNFGGPWKDGSLYMTHGGKSSYGGDPNWHAPPDYSRLYNPANPDTAISVANFSNISAVTPKFSPDGTKVAFGFWGASGKTLPKSPSGSLTADSTGKTMVVMDFGCSTSTCTASSSGFKVTNARNVTPGVTHKVGWPAFTPSGDAVLYQRQIGSAKAFLSSWSASDLNTIGGALAEIWISKIPPDSNTAAVPTQLRALNGLSPDGTTSYLPVTPASFSPSYHAANGSFKINQADNCGASATVSGVNDYQLNYLPGMAPTQAGGYNWVVFTSRRMYGNVAYDDPWDAEPGPRGCSGSPCSCASGNPPTKKLWIAAIDSSITAGTDPSHPAFYLPGQELMAGNSDGYWVTSQCRDVGASCTTNDDCCGGTGSSPTTRCSATSKTCQAISTCAPSGATCIASSDCCSGLVCGGSGTCITPQYFAQQVYKREYVADCPAGKQVVWRFFDWQATIPTGTSIGLGVQTKAEASDTYLPSSPIAMDSIVSTSPTGTWVHGSKTVGQVLATNASTIRSLKYLLVTMTFNPDASATLSPTLSNWRQNYDCLDGE